VVTASHTPVLLVVAPHPASPEEAQRRQQLANAGVTLLPAASHREALATLAQRGVHHLLVEGGAGLASQLLHRAAVDRLVIFQGSVILGRGALPAFDPLPGQRAAEAPRLRRVTSRTFGDDVMTVYAVSEL
jgi:diaminohydroxyphosphoribosylaminopyrimidine deaminase/5-amino-6-(5-phosphoribosylamino)uracil reductase